MQGTPTLTVLEVITDWDMRVKHDLRKKAMKVCNPGQCVIALNRSRDKAAVFDHVGGIWSVWAEKGMRFDLDQLDLYMTLGMKVGLRGRTKYRKELKIAA